MSYVTLVITSYKKVTKSYWELAEVANSSIFGDRVILRNRYFFAKNKIMFLADGQCKHWSLFFESLKVFFLCKGINIRSLWLSEPHVFVISVCLGAVLIAVVWFFLERAANFFLFRERCGRPLFFMERSLHRFFFFHAWERSSSLFVTWSLSIDFETLENHFKFFTYIHTGGSSGKALGPMCI